MKLLVVLLSATFFVLNSGTAIAEDKVEDLPSLKKQAITECSEKHQIAKDAIKDIINHVNVSEDRDVKCWISCVLKKLGVMKEGKLDWEKCKLISQSCLTNDEDKAKFDKIAEICQVEVLKDEKDECQLAYTAAACKIKHWNEFGLPKGNWSSDP